jgi:AbrB family looped-hinge helix DNA binding protein
MPTTLTSKGQVTIPKRIRDALGLAPGSTVDFEVDERGRVVIRPARRPRVPRRMPDRFEAARGRATVAWRTDALMRLLRDAG